MNTDTCTTLATENLSPAMNPVAPWINDTVYMKLPSVSASFGDPDHASPEPIKASAAVAGSELVVRLIFWSAVEASTLIQSEKRNHNVDITQTVSKIDCQ